MNMEEIIKTYGTPTYIFNIDELVSRVKYLRSVINDKVELCYAMKANPFIVNELPNEITRIEVCSPGEEKIVSKFVDSKNLVISGVYKKPKDIEDLIKNQEIGHYTIESYQQFELLNELSKKYQKKITCLVRLTSGNQFGVNDEELFKIIENRNDYDYLDITGIQYFSGTQRHSLKKTEKEFIYLQEIIEKLKNEYDYETVELEYGTGFPVFYFESDEFDEDSFLKEFNTLLMNYFSDKKVTLEIGRSIAASCGSYFTKVVDMKTNKNGNFTIVDGGIHQLVYYGQTMAMRVPFFDVLPKRNAELQTYNLYGSLCTINDILVKNIDVPKLELGDVFIFKNTGAYSSTEGISLFLSRDLPKVLICSRDKRISVVRDRMKTSEMNFPNYE